MRVVRCFLAEVRGSMGPACLSSGCSCCPCRPVSLTGSVPGGAGQQGRGWGARPALPEPWWRGPPRTSGTAWRPRQPPRACLDPVPLRGPPPPPCSGPGSHRCRGGVHCFSTARAPKSEGPGSPALQACQTSGALSVLPWRVPIRLDCRAALLRQGFLGPRILQDVYPHLKSCRGTGSGI